ncbi:MAG: cell division protein FtsZ, partial [Anaerolineae bacterium]|nr:cell division protein FtsZ [Anaerolineae bacterium]
GARGILFNVTGGPDMSLFEVNEAAAIIKDTADPEVNLIFGAVIDPNMGDSVRITVIATGFEQSRVARRQMQTTSSSQPMRPAVQQRRPAQSQGSQSVQSQQPPQQQGGAQPAQPQQPVGPDQQYKVYDSEDIDIPAFLRKR